MSLLRLDNPVMDYAWGSREAIAALQGRPTPSPKPEAELWIGAHPKAPSRVEGRSLAEIIQADPVGVLGAAAAATYDGRLPFLLKLLAAAEPLSIQAHPDAGQALAGFAREEAAGLPVTDPRRNYRDQSAKPEVIFALSELWALSGFRPREELLELLDAAALDELAPELQDLREIPGEPGLRRFFAATLTLPDARRATLLDQLAAAARGPLAERPEGPWLERIAARHPGDAGLLSVLLLNLIKLEPGQALAAGARCLHAYLEGFGVELMANSDNVLRGGLTPKHVDVPELLDVLAFKHESPTVLDLEGRGYRCPTGEFRLDVFRPGDGEPWRSPSVHGLDIVLSLGGGPCVVRDERLGQAVDLLPGAACAVTAETGAYTVRGRARVARASTPEPGGPA
ncbi:MAG TPA: mannose-6-phosphate isomerase, class I [Candidatus Krumholzibacteria bacterium]|nr:mannose-6-phosphate isomerase, class I [Candidatus Krumholzibacteria bacterium]HRX51818.1 mannose-6-phosphate isomerase, class I [Candidatus Krumholzibacteria bacterium]